jgi:hypothetical protein
MGTLTFMNIMLKKSSRLGQLLWLNSGAGYLPDTVAVTCSRKDFFAPKPRTKVWDPYPPALYALNGDFFLFQSREGRLNIPLAWCREDVIILKCIAGEEMMRVT